VAALEDGGFVVAWRRDLSDIGTQFDILGRRFDADGTARDGTEFQINTFTSAAFLTPQPSVAGLADGGFVVSWATNDIGSIPLPLVLARRYDADGVAVDPAETQVAVPFVPDGTLHTPVVALDDGGYVVFWETPFGASAGLDIFGKRYDASSVPEGFDPVDFPLGQSFRVNTKDAGDQFAPSVARLADGGFPVYWSSDDGDRNEIFTQSFGADGNRRAPLSIAGSDDANTIRGGSGNEIIEAGSGDDVLSGGAGDDTLIGGGGADTTTHADDPAGIVANVKNGIVTDGFGGTDTLAEIETIVGSAFDDVFIVDYAGSTLDGGGGIDTIDFSALATDPLLVHNLVDLLTGQYFPVGTGQAPSSLASIENASGSPFVDIFAGSSGDNTLSGGAGFDRLAGRVGDDTLTGGPGDDGLDGGFGTDVAIFSGAMGDYRIEANLSQSSVFVRVRDDAPTVDGNDGSDLLTGVQTLRFENGDLLIETRESGEDLTVNTQTGNDQSQPSVIGDIVSESAFNDWTVVWREVSDDGGTTSIRGRFFDSFRATPDGLPFEIASVGAATGDLASPRVVQKDKGDLQDETTYFATWEALNQDGSGWGVFGRHFDATGSPLSSPIQINTFTNFDQESHATTRLFTTENTGHILTVWASEGQDGPSGIYGQRIGGNGELVDRHGVGPGADEFRIDTDTAANNSNPTVATLNSEFIVVAWESKDVDTGAQTVQLRLYDSSAGLDPIGNPLNADSSGTNTQSSPSISALDAGFVVNWEEQGRDGDGSGIFARRFQVVENELGAPTGVASLGDSYQVNETSEGNQQAPAVTENSDGSGFFVTWQSPSVGDDSSNTDIYARAFNPDGDPVGLTVVSGTDADDTIHARRGDEILEGGGGDDTLSAQDGSDTLDGGSGLDTVDYAYDEQFGATGNIVVDLGNGTGIDGFGDTDTLIGIERVVATGNDDTLIGSDGADVLRGGGGDDTLVGGAGTDAAEYSGSVGDYVIAPDLSSVSGPDGTDTLIGIERLQFDDGTFFPDPLPNAAPTLAVADLVGIAGVASPAGDLAEPSDPDGDAIGIWSFQDQTFGGGRFEISGLGDPVFEDGSFKFKDGAATLVTVTGGVNTDIADGLANELGTITVVAGSLSHVSFAPGIAGDADTLAVQVEDAFGLASPWETLTFSTVSSSLANGYLSDVLASGSNRGGDFGASVALSADGLVALVGAAWTETRLTASDGGALDRFGSSVALSADGQFAVVGAPDADLAGDDDQGAVYLYEWDGAAWAEQAITFGTPAPGAQLGASVGISDDGARVLAGAPGDLSAGDAGGTVVFDIAGGGVTETTLTNEGGTEITGRGLSVALSADGKTALVGAAKGSATVHETDPVTFELNGTLLTSGDGGGGVALSADGTRALVGSPNDDLPGNIDQGSAYVFDLVGGTWSQDARLVRETGTALERFGATVALAADGATALVGSVEERGGAADSEGSATLTDDGGGAWLHTPLIADGRTPAEVFGAGLALTSDGATALIGGADARLFAPPQIPYPVATAGPDVLAVDDDAPPADLRSLVLGNDADAGGGPLELIGIDTTGTIGTVGFDRDAQMLTFEAGPLQSLNPGEVGPDSFGYIVRTESGALARGTVDVTITGTDNVPETFLPNHQTSPADTALILRRIDADDPGNVPFVADPDAGEIVTTVLTVDAGTRRPPSPSAMTLSPYCQRR